MKLWRPGSGLVAALLSGALLAISRDTGQFGWLVLVAPIPLLVHVMHEQSSLRVFGLAFAVGLMAESSLMFFYGSILPLIFALAAFQALLFALDVLFLYALYRRFAPTVAIFGFAVMAAASEYLYSLVSPNGSFGALGYALVDVLPLLQTASLFGVPGLTFLAAMIPAGLAVLWTKPRDTRAMAAWGIPVVASLLYGIWQLTEASGPTVRIALLSDDRYAGRVFNHPDSNEKIRKAFVRQITKLAPHKPDAIVLPEKILADGTELTPPAGGIIVAGIEGQDRQGRRLNIASLYRPNNPVETYSKKRMVPVLEADYVPGSSELITTVGGQRTGIAICKDMDFAQDLRVYGQHNVGLMLVPAWDFDRDAYLHGRMAIVRGVENGFSLARSSSQGLMTLSDSKGRIIAEKRTSPRPDFLVGDLSVGLGRAVYSRIGDIFAQFVSAVWFGLLTLLFWHKRAVRRQESSSINLKR